MITARSIAEKYFPKDPRDQQLLETDILRYMEDQLWRKFGDVNKALIDTHVHRWEDEFPAIIGPNSTTSGGSYLVCKCGARQLKYQVH